MDIDEAFSSTVGQFGRFQFFITAILASAHLFAPLNMMGHVFVGDVPTLFQCIDRLGRRTPGCGNSDTTCVTYIFNETFSSIATEWNLVCEDGYKVDVVQGVFMLGVLTGSVIFGLLADKIGRHRSMVIAAFGTSLVGWQSALAGDFLTFACLRTLVGVFQGGIILVTFVHATEIIGSMYRAAVGVIVHGVFAFGIVLLAWLGFMYRNWRTLTFISCFPTLFLLLISYIVPESPRWLLSRGHVKAAESVLENISRRNGMAPPAGRHVELYRPTSRPVQSSFGILDILRNPVLRNRSGILFMGWFVDCGAYYGLTMSSSRLGNGKYMSVALSGLIEVPAYIIAIIILNKLGRHFAYAGFMILGGIFCLLLFIFLNLENVAMTILALLGKLAISSSYGVAFIYCAELYPTVVRSNGMSICSMGGRTGGIIAPFIVSLSVSVPGFHYFVFGSMALLVGVASISLPETMNLPLYETIEDMTSQSLAHSKAVGGSLMASAQLKLLEENIAAQEKFLAINNNLVHL